MRGSGSFFSLLAKKDFRGLLFTVVLGGEIFVD